MTASAARRAPSEPIPPQISTSFPFSKNRKVRPPCAFSLARQFLTKGPTSRSRATTMATLDIVVCPKPIDRTSKRALHRNDSPLEFSLSFARTGEHLLLPHAHCVD